MLRTFNIFVDTPCCILTQEESKRLIHGSAREKYEFFLKATGLRMIHEELTLADKMVEDARGRLDELRPTMDSAKQHRDECKQRVDEFLQLDHFQARIREETAKLYWYDVRVQEGVVLDFQERLEGKQEEVESAKEKLGDTSLADLESQVQDLNFKIDELNEAKGPVDDAYEAKHDALRGLQHSESQLRNHQRAMVAKKKEYNDRLKVVSAMVRVGLRCFLMSLISHPCSGDQMVVYAAIDRGGEGEGDARRGEGGEGSDGANPATPSVSLLLGATR